MIKQPLLRFGLEAEKQRYELGDPTSIRVCVSVKIYLLRRETRLSYSPGLRWIFGATCDKQDISIL